MSISLQSDRLLQSVGYSVKSSNGEHLGKISAVTRDKTEKTIEYVILESNGFIDSSEHFFAIPASSAFIKLTESKNIILKLSKEALRFARRITADKCPKPDFKNGGSLYELI